MLSNSSLLRQSCALAVVITSGVMPLAARNVEPQHVFSSALAAIPSLLGVHEEHIGKPVRLSIPSLQIEAHMEHVDIAEDGAMEAPEAWENVGWFAPGPRPGEQGNAVIAGHLDSDTGTAVFWELGKIKLSDVITVTDEFQQQHRFRVSRIERYNSDEAPIGEIFKEGTERTVVLITCGGNWSKAKQKYDERLVVYAEMIED